MTMTANDLATQHGLAPSDVEWVLASDVDQREVANRLGVAPNVAGALVRARASKDKGKKKK
jgi:hypothetical protein